MRVISIHMFHWIFIDANNIFYNLITILFIIGKILISVHQKKNLSNSQKTLIFTFIHKKNKSISQNILVCRSSMFLKKYTIYGGHLIQV